METRGRLEIRLWVQKAIALYESAGEDEVLRQIADPQGQFIQDKRYIFALDIEGKLLAHPFSKPFVGMNLLELKDCEGRTFVRKMVATAKTRGYGFTDYKWQAPDSKEEFQKTIFFERVDQIVLCGGFYSKTKPLEAL
jgi:signal transduction histidine kinase